MSKKTILVFVGFVFLFSFNIARASVVINEIKILPTEDRFIELYNKDSSEVNLTDWYIQRKTQTGSSFGSLVSKTYFENKKISANGYFLISRSQLEKSDVVLSSLTLTESNVIQIKNGNGDVVDKVCYGDVADCGEQKVSNPPEGQSVQRDNNSLFIVGNATPGTQNFIASSVPPPSVGNNSSVSGVTSVVQNSVETKTKVVEIPKIKTKITAKDFVFTGIPVEFKVNTTGHSNEPLFYGKYFWNFGDGDSKTIKADDRTKILHTYPYEGEYVVTLEYYSNYYLETVDAIDKFVINVVKPEIIISKVGDEKDFFVEITNNTDYDADLSNWFLSSNIKNFIFPRNMILESKKKLILSPKITGFSVLDKNSLKLLNSQKEVVFEYISSIKQTEVPIVVEKNTVIPKKVIPVSPNKEIQKDTPVDKIENLPIENPKMEIPFEELGATAIKTNVNTNSNFVYIILGFIVFLGVASGASYFIRSYNRKLSTDTNGSDFEIIDE